MKLEIITEIKNTVIESMGDWLPFVRLNDIKVSMSVENVDYVIPSINQRYVKSKRI